MARRRGMKDGALTSAEPEEKVEMMVCLPGDGNKLSAPRLKEELLMRLGSGLGERGNVVMTRLDNADLKRIDALVEVEAFKSRSEAAAFFIRQGIQSRTDLFEKVMPTVEKIKELKEQAKKELGKEAQVNSGASK